MAEISEILSTISESEFFECSDVPETFPLRNLYGLYLILSKDYLLNADVAIPAPDAPEGPTFPARRSLVRNFGSLVEGVTYALKQLILEEAKLTGSALTIAEQSALSEISVTLSNRGEVEENDLRLRPIPNIRFALSKASDFFAANPPVDFSDHRWGLLQDSIRVRNRLMHPKSRESLEVSSAEFIALHSAYNWFSESMHRIFDAYGDYNLRCRDSHPV